MSTQAAASAVVHPGQWRLDRVELVNWGTFSGLHRIDVARKGFLLTGHSGSGKSSLVDAIAAVLTPRGKLHFNAAAADGSSRREDRTVASYVRGAWRRRADEATGEVTSEYLRPGATWSGILLRYSDGTDAPPVSLIKLFHLTRGASGTDVNELHVILSQEVTLGDFEELARSGLDTRRIKARWPEGTVTGKHSAFSARFTRLLGITGDNALLLLHKTQSAKSLGNLDDLFRNFMLDEPRTRALAETAIAQFGDLSQAHASVVQARLQLAMLRTLEPHVRAYEDHSTAADEAAALHEALDLFKDTWKHKLAVQEHAVAAAGLLNSERDRDLAEHASLEAQTELDGARQLVSQRGGAALAEQRLRVENHEGAAAFARSHRADLEDTLTAVGITLPTSFAEYEELRASARIERDGFEAAQERTQTSVVELFDAKAALRQRREANAAELAALKSGRSNMEARLVDARAIICRATGLPPGTLPFAGELLQVKASSAAWSGAIERVLRPLATLMLVPAAHREAVSRAVEAAHLGTRLVFESIPAAVDTPRGARSSGSVVSRVDVADGAMSPWLHWMLSRSYDYECVDDVAALASTDQAVTLAGQVKRGPHRYEKDDRSRVGDRARWILGFDNAAKVDHFLAELKEIEAEARTVEAALATQEKARSAAQRRVDALTILDRREWADLDVAAAEEALQRSRQRIDELRAASGDLRAAEKAEADAIGALASARAAEQVVLEALAAVRGEVRMLEQVIAELTATLALALEDGGAQPPPHHDALEERFLADRTARSTTHRTIDDTALRVSKKLANERDAATRAAGEAERRFQTIAAAFKSRWFALAGDLTSDIADRAGYLELLARLAGDRLPEFELQFFALLERQSRNNVGQLANEIRRAPNEIRARIDPVNKSLRRSVFDEGRYLRIDVKDNRSPAAKEFLDDLKEIVSDTWADQDRQAAETKFAVMDRVMKRLMSSEPGDRNWQDLCLDTRRHVQFIGAEIDEFDAVVNVHDSGGGLSGGQKQKLVIFCLAAALRFQLAADGEDMPRFGSVILDEAFDKADATFTTMAMDIFVEFGFHMILATPLKLLQTLENYVGGIALATCRDSRASSIGLVPFGEAHLASEGAA